jgi:hypothetical protein
MTESTAHSLRSLLAAIAARIWPLAAAAVLLWPAHAVAAFDGIPLDGRAEAVAIGVLVPVLWWLRPQFFKNRMARAAVVVLVALKLLDAAFLTPQGWCARFEMSSMPPGQSPVQLSWDARADWRHTPPACSAIVARSYSSFTRFPAWFLNLQNTRPPNVPVTMTIDGYVNPRDAGALTIETNGARVLRGSIGATPIASAAGGTIAVSLPPGPSRVQITADFIGSSWKFAPAWNGTDLFGSVLTTRTAPGAIDRLAGYWLPALATAVSLIFLGAWTWSAVAAIGPTPAIAIWVVGAAILFAAVGVADVDRWGRPTVLLLALALVVPMPRRLQNVRGVFVLIGLPWLALLVAASVTRIGRISMYSVGDDWLEFQRFAHRIFMQGYWLEGGQTMFWNQPLYRWIAGALHIVFGDSSVGEGYLDAAALLTGALFAFYAVKRVVGFTWGLTAAVATLATIAAAPTWYTIGRGLSEIVSAGFAYLAAFLLIESGRGRLTPAVIAGACIVLAFWARLNNLPFLVALAILGVSLRVGASAIWRPLTLVQRVRWTPVLAAISAAASGLFLLALRTWHYTGVFSPFYGTQREHLSNIQSTGVAATLRRVAESVLVVVTAQDPPRFDLRAILLVAGVAIAIFAFTGAPLLREVPLPLCALCLAGIAGAVVARGSAYPGRFSIHLIPLGVSITTIAAARVVRTATRRP